MKYVPWGVAVACVFVAVILLLRDQDSRFVCQDGREVASREDCGQVAQIPPTPEPTLAPPTQVVYVCWDGREVESQEECAPPPTDTAVPEPTVTAVPEQSTERVVYVCTTGQEVERREDCPEAPTQPPSDPTSAPEIAQPALATSVPPPPNDCTAAPDNAGGGSPQLVVAEGHRLSVQWYFDEQPQQQSILEQGVYEPLAGVRVGAYWDYPNCPREIVEVQARNSNGSITDFSNGFTRVG